MRTHGLHQPYTLSRAGPPQPDGAKSSRAMLSGSGKLRASTAFPRSGWNQRMEGDSLAYPLAARFDVTKGENGGKESASAAGPAGARRAGGGYDPVARHRRRQPGDRAGTVGGGRRPRGDPGVPAPH